MTLLGNPMGLPQENPAGFSWCKLPAVIDFFPTKAQVWSTVTTAATKNPFHITSASAEVFFMVMFPSNTISVSSSKELSLTNSLRKCEGSTVSSCLSWVMVVLPFQPPCWNVSAPFWKPPCDHGLHRSIQGHPTPIRNQACEELIMWITQYPELGGIHKDHQFQLLTLHRTSQQSHSVPKSIF